MHGLYISKLNREGRRGRDWPREATESPDRSKFEAEAWLCTENVNTLVYFDLTADEVKAINRIEAKIANRIADEIASRGRE